MMTVSLVWSECSHIFHHILLLLACPMTDCCRVYETSPKCPVVGLSLGSVDPVVGRFCTSIDPLQPRGMWKVKVKASHTRHRALGPEPLLSARPAVTSPAAEHHRPLVGTKLYCLVTEAHRFKQLAQGCYAALPRAGFEPVTYWLQAQMPYPLHHRATCVCRHLNVFCNECWSKWCSHVLCEKCCQASSYKR